MASFAKAERRQKFILFNDYCVFRWIPKQHFFPNDTLVDQQNSPD